MKISKWRQVAALRQIAAWRQVATALRKLIADKEDTKQVFVILRALSGRSGARAYARFKKQPHTAKITQADHDLISHLNDRDWLKQLPEGSLGRRYYQFTEVEQISADGLVQASEEGGDYENMSPQQRHFQMRQRDAHDLWHVTTGYGRDGLGELALLAFSFRQLGNVGLLLIIAAGVRIFRKEAPSVNAWGAVREGFRLGKRARWLPAAHWEHLLTRPLDEVRAQFNVGKPSVYRDAVKELHKIQSLTLAAAE